MKLNYIAAIVVASLSTATQASDFPSLDQAVPNAEVINLAPVFDFDGDGCLPSAGISRTGQMNAGLSASGSMPLGLYLSGVIPEGPYVSIVGTRQPSLYGQKICRELAKGLAEAGFCIVSGMARGIDSIAHETALSADGKTMAFLGSGIDIVYPPENLNLYQEIAKRGAVLSEFPFGRKADRRTFPMRNRLVSGISSAVIVIESAASGGSLITAQFAAEQGRLVFAVPGRVDQPASAGCNQLIRDGATLVRNVQDILEELEGTILEGISFSQKQQKPNQLV